MRCRIRLPACDVVRLFLDDSGSAWLMFVALTHNYGGSVRIIAGIAGVLVLALAAHGTIGASGGYDQPTAILVIVLAIATALGACALGAAMRRGRMAMALAVAFGLVVLEGAALISLSHDVTVWREATEANRLAAQRKHDVALRRRDEARATLQAASATPPVSSRQAAAQVALDAAVATIREKAGPACKDSCQRGLLSQAADARRELEAAQAETTDAAEQARRAADEALARAEQTLIASPIPAAAVSTANRFGIEPWLFDVLSLVVVRVPAGALGAAILAFAAHGQARLPRWSLASPPLRKTSATAAVPIVAGDPGGRGRVSRFVSDYLEVAPAGRIEVGELFAAYKTWCRMSNLDAIDRADFGDELPEALDVAGLRVKAYQDKVYVVGVAVRA